jgi:hypothetical protein
MQRFEYTVQVVKLPLAHVESREAVAKRLSSQLYELSESGWELVAVVNGFPGELLHYFKRPFPS